MIQNKYIIICLFLGLTTQALAQDFIIGSKYGYGKSNYKRQSDGLMISSEPTHRVGISLEFSPYFSRFFVVSGIEYETNKLGNSISIPLGIRITLGKTLRPFFEAGGFFSYPLLSKQTDYTLEKDFGARVGGGLIYYINKRWRTELGYFYRFGFKSVLREEIQLPMDQVTIEQYDLRAGNLELCVKYRF